MPPGRGSLSGSNAHGRWVVCSKCRLRLSYTPTVGSHGHYRQAGPLSQDSTKVLEKMTPEMLEKSTERERLNARQVAMAGAEASLKKRLEEVQAKKNAMPPRERPSAQSHGTPSKAERTGNTGGYMTVTAESKKQVKRENEVAAEVQEAGWETVPIAVPSEED